MLTRLEFQFPQAPQIEKLTENEKKLLQYVEDIKKSVAETFRTLNRPDVLTIDQATISDSTITPISQTGTGSTFVMSASPTFTGTLTGSAVSLSSFLNMANAQALQWANAAAAYSPVLQKYSDNNVYLDNYDGPINIRAGSAGSLGAAAFFTTGGHLTVATLTAGGTLGVTGISTFGSYLRAVDGSSTTPAYSFTGETTMGMYRSGDDVHLKAKSGGSVYLDAAGSYVKVSSSGCDLPGAFLAYYNNGTQVVGGRITGYTAMTGTADKATAYATSTITLQQLAERVKAIQDNLTTHGLIGA